MAPCEKSWAGRVVILLQLVSWCAVGALLLHRGISSVKQPVAESPVINHTEVQEVNTSLKAKLSEQSTEVKVNLQRVSDNTLEKQEVSMEKQEVSLGKKEVSLEKKQEGSLEKKQEGSLEVTEGEESGVNETTPAPHKTPPLRNNVRVASTSRKGLVLTPSGVVMAALGAIMLILGPSIVILKCCEAGSRGRFSKLYGHDPALALSALDRPPAYEEVAENAPRYSTLFPDDENTPFTITVSPRATTSVT